MSTINIEGRTVELVGATGANLPDLSGNDWRDAAAQSADNGMDSVHAFLLGAGMILYVHADQGVAQVAEVIEAPAVDFAGWIAEWGGHPAEDAWTREEYIASFGLDPGIKPADPASDGPRAIWVEPCYYAGTYNAPIPAYLRDEDGAIVEFPDHAAAMAHVAAYLTAPSGYDGVPACRVLSHGQAGPDDLIICEAQ